MALIIMPMSRHIDMMRRISISRGMVRTTIGQFKVLILVEMSRTLNTSIIAWKFITNINIDKIIG